VYKDYSILSLPHPRRIASFVGFNIFPEKEKEFATSKGVL